MIYKGDTYFPESQHILQRYVSYMVRYMKRSKKVRFTPIVFTVILILTIVLYGRFLAEKKEHEQDKQVQETTQEITDEPKELYAQSAVLMDADSGRILFGKNEDKVRPMASTTKIMTCILTLENLTDSQTARVSKKAAGQPPVRLGVKEGEEYVIRDLLHSLMLESHNDSAVVIAEAIGGSVEGFAQMMNQKAADLGCMDTHFVTPNGLDGEDEKGIHATTAADLARIMKYCITESPKKEEFLEITRAKDYTFTDVSGKRNFSCSNHNAFLTMMDGALSGKTGFTAEAGYCYVGALRRDDRTFIVALLACGWPNNKGYKWKDTRKLMEYGLENYEYRDVRKDMGKAEIPVQDGVHPENEYVFKCSVPVGMRREDKEDEIRILLRKDEKVTAKKNLKTSLNAPVKAGEKAGEYIYSLDGEEIRRYDVITLESIERRNLYWCLNKMLRRICL